MSKAPLILLKKQFFFSVMLAFELNMPEHNNYQRLNLMLFIKKIFSTDPVCNKFL